MQEEHGLKKHRVCKNCNKSAYKKQICITLIQRAFSVITTAVL